MASVIFAMDTGLAAPSVCSIYVSVEGLKSLDGLCLSLELVLPHVLIRRRVG